MTRRYRYLWTVAFGTFRPQEFVTAQQCFAYLDERMRKHGRGCFSVDGPHGNWSQYADCDVWVAICEDADRFDSYYRMVADRG
jgi:hypothetical protein